MKSQILVDQYNNIRDAIVNNVQTIKILIEQSERLTEIIQQLNSGTNEEERSKLQEQVEQLQSSILNLIKQTENLFDMYNKFAEQLFE